MDRSELIKLYTESCCEDTWERDMVSVIMDASIEERKGLLIQALTEYHKSKHLITLNTARSIGIHRKRMCMKHTAIKFLKDLLIDELSINDEDAFDCITNALFSGYMKRSRSEKILGGLCQICIFPIESAGKNLCNAVSDSDWLEHLTSTLTNDYGATVLEDTQSIYVEHGEELLRVFLFLSPFSNYSLLSDSDLDSLGEGLAHEVETNKKSPFDSIRFLVVKSGSEIYCKIQNGMGSKLFEIFNEIYGE